MAAYNKFNQFVQNLANGAMNLGSDALHVMLSNVAPNGATNQNLADITEIGVGNGYAAGGNAVTTTSCTQTSGTLKLILVSTVFTASGGTIGPFRYAVLYDATPTSPLKPLIAWWDYGSSITLNATETFTVSFDGTNGVLQIA
jgi:hypothetical protein